MGKTADSGPWESTWAAGKGHMHSTEAETVQHTCSVGIRVRETWVPIPALPLPGWLSHFHL